VPKSNLRKIMMVQNLLAKRFPHPQRGGMLMAEIDFLF